MTHCCDYSESLLRTLATHCDPLLLRLTTATDYFVFIAVENRIDLKLRLCRIRDHFEIYNQTGEAVVGQADAALVPLHVVHHCAMSPQDAPCQQENHNLENVFCKLEEPVLHGIKLSICRKCATVVTGGSDV